ncbi:MAG TPA: hypothetical protein VLF89_06005, partial [Candidatus Saccharimonadales bacterium]|nr:hypothetical protein [Candidatus Saccharimonadales bacterium]
TVAVLSDSREYKFALFKNLIGIPNSVAHVFHQAMDRNPENRHPSSVQFLEDVARAASLPERTVVPLSTRKPLATAKK